MEQYVEKGFFAFVIVYLFTIIAIIYFRKDGVTIWDVISIFLQRGALNYETKFRDIFNPTGIVLLSIGSVVAFLYVASWAIF